MKNIPLLIGALLSALAVILAALTSHSHALHLNTISHKQWQLALSYHQFYALVVTILGLLCHIVKELKLNSYLKKVSYVFIISLFLFSFSLYMVAFFQIEFFKYLVPFGGSGFILAWILLSVLALKTSVPN